MTLSNILLPLFKPLGQDLVIVPGKEVENRTLELGYYRRPPLPSQNDPGQDYVTAHCEEVDNGTLLA